jgi:hypothetical protein
LKVDEFESSEGQELKRRGKMTQRRRGRGGSERRGRVLAQRARRKNTEDTEKTQRAIVGCPNPSTTRPDAPECGAKEKVGPLRSG